MGIGIVGDSQEEITPFQRQVFEAEQVRKQREQEKRQEQAMNGGGGSGRPQNQLKSSQNPHAKSETVRYENNGSQSEDSLEVF